MKPGVYIQVGNSVHPLKSMELLSSLLGGDSGNSPATLAQNVAWVFTALERRKTRISEVEYAWLRGGKQSDMPVSINLRQFLQRTDEALQIIGAAYWYKIRDGAGRVKAFRWLDPRSMRPDDNSLRHPTGYENYKRSTSAGEIDVPARDLIVFRKLGLSEYVPSSIAGQSTALAAEVLAAIDEAGAVVYRNPIPISLLTVPSGTGEQEKNALKNFFYRVMNKSSSATPDNRVVPVYEGVKVDRISMTPDEMNFDTVREPSIDAILAAHGVPKSEVIGNAANYATAQLDARNFIMRIGSRLADIADTVNADEDMRGFGVELRFYPQRHPELQKDEKDVSAAFVNYLNGFTPQAAAHLVGITPDEFPDNLVIFADAQDVTQDEPQAKSSAPYLDDLRRWRRKALRKGGACEFESDTIPADMHDDITAALDGAKSDGAIKRVFDERISGGSRATLATMLDTVISALVDDAE